MYASVMWIFGEYCESVAELCNNVISVVFDVLVHTEELLKLFLCQILKLQAQNRYKNFGVNEHILYTRTAF